MFPACPRRDLGEDCAPLLRAPSTTAGNAVGYPRVHFTGRASTLRAAKTNIMATGRCFLTRPDRSCDVWILVKICFFVEFM